jgi:hypothetical protein
LADHAALQIYRFFDLKLSLLKRDYFQAFLSEQRKKLPNVLGLHMLISDLKGEHNAVEIQIFRGDIVILESFLDLLGYLHILRRYAYLVKVSRAFAVLAESGELARHRHHKCVRFIPGAPILADSALAPKDAKHVFIG